MRKEARVMRIYFGTAREIEMGRRRPAAPLKQITDKEIDKVQRVSASVGACGGGRLLFHCRAKSDRPDRTYATGQGKKLKAFRCTEKTSRLLKKAAKKEKSARLLTSKQH